MTTIRWTALACATVLTLAACGGGDDDTSAAADTPIGQALTASMMEDDSPLANEEDARCFSGKVVNDIGEDRLIELGVTEDNVGEIEDIDFTDGEIDTIVDSMFDCTDLSQALADEMAGEFGEESAKCVADELDEDFVKTMMKSGFGEDAEMPEEFFQTFLDIAAKCDLPLG